MRTPTGQYRIDFYDKYGQRLADKSKNCETLTESMRQAMDKKKLYKDIIHSYTISRVIYNSLDKEEA